nr:hypothetical protein Iba_chr04bCG15650 [Ipomoea batatas]
MIITFNQDEIIFAINFIHSSISSSSPYQTPIISPSSPFAGVAGHHHQPLSSQPETPSEELANHSHYSPPLLVKGYHGFEESRRKEHREAPVQTASRTRKIRNAKSQTCCKWRT